MFFRQLRKSAAQVKKLLDEIFDLKEKVQELTRGRDEAREELRGVQKALKASQKRVNDIESYAPKTPPRTTGGRRRSQS